MLKNRIYTQILYILTLIFSVIPLLSIEFSSVRANPYNLLFKGASEKKLAETNYNFTDQQAILNHVRNDTTTVNVIAFRVEFKLDSSELTTGNGHFGISEGDTVSTIGDREEIKYYSQNVYKYDNIPHYKSYFSDQLEYVKNYYSRVSYGRLNINYTIYPNTSDSAYEVPKQMFEYSPALKKAKETWDEYYYRKSKGLMKFISDAVSSADKSESSPFKNISLDSLGNTVFLLIHAGASYLTDGGPEGYMGQDSPSDMIDAFISRDFFSYYSDSIDGIGCEGDSCGIKVTASDGEFLIDELMMVSETSNQDSLNWGIHGILVNQMARQLGIPDLFSTSSGISGVGSFCIMDFAGYSAAHGFIPPWPSAWVRAYMGWDIPYIADINTQSNYNIKAVSAASSIEDTTILLVPLNDHEYYLIENRQRNLTGDTTMFNYDSIDGTHYISIYDQVNFESGPAVISTFPGESNCIDSVINYDVGLPASGLLVWHVDEDIIRERLEYNLINADSLYRAVNLVEADGITDLGVVFKDLFYQSVFDYGGAEDVFPHKVIGKPEIGSDNDKTFNRLVDSFGPFTRPATKCNDGSHTYLKFSFPVNTRNTSSDISSIRDYFVANYVDSILQVNIKIDSSYIEGNTGWPGRLLPSSYFDPVLCNLTGGSDTLEALVIDSSGSVYIFDSDGSSNSLGDTAHTVIKTTLRGDTVFSPDSALELDSIPFFSFLKNPVSFPTVIDNDVYFPVRSNQIIILKSLEGNNTSSEAVWDTINLSFRPSTYLCNYSDTRWAMGCSNGTIIFGDSTSITASIPGEGDISGKPVNSLASVDPDNNIIAAVYKNGYVSLVSPDSLQSIFKLGGEKISPYSITSADLNPSDDNDSPDLIINDSRQGLWLLKSGDEISTAENWKNTPLDWPGYYSYREDTSDDSRELLPKNGSSPSIADIDGNGTLDIITGGSNGLYAINYTGSLIKNWPYYLDNRYWYQRGKISYTPVIGTSSDNTPLVVFSVPTGEYATFGIGKIDTIYPDEGKVVYYRINTTGDTLTDSISDLTDSFIDSLVEFGDSLILPYITPGGYIDAVNSDARRPLTSDEPVDLPNTGEEWQSHWPFTTGGTPASAPILTDMDSDGNTDIITVSKNGWLYRWETSGSIISSSYIWPQTGFNSSRTFAYAGPGSESDIQKSDKIRSFYNFPNPARDVKSVIFRYDLGQEAKNVKLDIYTYTGYHIYSSSSLPGPYGITEFEFPKNRFRKLGPGVYRCRLKVTFDNNSSRVKYWKMAVIK